MGVTPLTSILSHKERRMLVKTIWNWY